MSHAGNNSRVTLVWDLPLRVIHWLLVVLVPASWVTQSLGGRYMDLHVWLGYAMGVLIVFRVAWGLLGPRSARFATFLRGPRAVAAYLRDWIRGRPAVHAGHNPAGGWAAIAMLALLAAQVTSGMMNSDDTLHYGPWHFAVSAEAADTAGAVHDRGFDVLLALIAVHVVAILLYQLRLGHDLVRPMITGRMPVDGPGIGGSRLWLACLLLMIAAAVIWAVVASAPAPDPVDMGLF